MVIGRRTMECARKDRPAAMKAGTVHLLFGVVATVLLAREAVGAPNLRGVAPEDHKYFQTAIIKCKDGSNSFSQERLNDDFCDCVDGTDEPGTNACPEAKFYCQNVGYKPVLLFSSRVNDGICDCCDGSDEYDGKTKCSNTCWEVGSQSREKLKKKLGVFKEGAIIRKQDVENAKRLRHQHEEELVSLKREEKHLKELVGKLRADKEAVEKEEKRERDEKEKREKEEQERMEKEISATKEKESTPIKEESQDAEEVSDQVEVPAENIEEEEEEISPEVETSEAEELDKLSEEERGRVIASRWTGEDISDIKAKLEGPEHSSDTDDEEDEETDHSHENDHDHEDDDYDPPPYAPESSRPISTQSFGGADNSWWSRLMVGPSAILKLFGLSGRPAVDVSEGQRIRKEFQEASDKLHSIEAKTTELESRLKEKFGAEGEFYGFYDRCFEFKDKKYTYKVCPFKDATQVEGHSTTRLGRWQGFKDDYTNMIFEHGDRCWNGPERSLRVRMRCGTKLELRGVDEPSRCEYVAEFSTPALCLESRVQVLEQQLALPNPDLGHHEEL